MRETFLCPICFENQLVSLNKKQIILSLTKIVDFEHQFEDDSLFFATSVHMTKDNVMTLDHIDSNSYLFACCISNLLTLGTIPNHPFSLHLIPACTELKLAFKISAYADNFLASGSDIDMNLLLS